MNPEVLFDVVLGHTDDKEPMQAGRTLAWSPNGERLALAGVVTDEDTVVGPGPSWAEVWVLDAKGDVCAMLQGGGGIAWSRDGARLWTTSPAGAWDPSGGRRDPPEVSPPPRSGASRASRWVPSCAWT